MRRTLRPARAVNRGIARWFLLLLALAYGVSALAQFDGGATTPKQSMQLGDVLKRIAELQRDGNELTVLDMLRGMQNQLGAEAIARRVW